ncbi:phage virion morphogenesis protein [Ruminiclostridium sufflavum DSM 19573]|uniref:Phage virion morphogenesis protein n=1 Tax=Ruminiclostridium sufflavum DSM 19573 TaxID=1121337 RepID=A0A318XK53_9FIRM|nr:phage virion morphogenesis protein [Ruminiclostridium sufflavum]PYG86733.1 phage virion morphogenesis protein [Ruminiclostridium sufflavum DSM 19573]
MYSIRLDGDTRRLIKRLRQLKDIDKKGINATIAQAVRGSTVQRFKTEKSPDGKKWKKSIRAEQEGGVTLVQSAELKKSIRYRTDASGFVVGTNKIYAATHQLGAKNRRITIRAKTSKGLVFQMEGRWIRKKQVTVRINIPARPFLGLSDEDMEEIKGTINDYFAED